MGMIIRQIPQREIENHRNSCLRNLRMIIRPRDGTKKGREYFVTDNSSVPVCGESTGVLFNSLLSAILGYQDTVRFKTKSTI